MKGILFSLLLCGCAVQTLPDNAYQAQAAQIISAYNLKHHLNLEVPEVRLGSTQAPFAGTTWCNSRQCFITLNPQLSANLNQTLIHELSHAICVNTVHGCLVTDHDKTWQEIALELGLSDKDSYISD